MNRYLPIKWLLLIGLLTNPLVLLMQALLHKVGITIGVLDELGGLIRLACFLLIIIGQRKSLSGLYLGIVTAMALVIMVSYLFYPENRPAMEQMFLSPGILIIVAMSFAFATFAKMDLFIEAHIQAALPILVLNLINTVLYTPKSGFGLNYLSFGYHSLIALAFLILAAYRIKNVKNIVIAVFAALSIILLAGRGAAIITLALVVVFYFYYHEPKYRLRTLAITLLVTVLFVAFLPNISHFINGNLAKAGLVSRTFIGIEKTPSQVTEQMVEEQFETGEPEPPGNNNATSTKLSVLTRLELWKKAAKRILITPLIGDGIGADRTLYGMYAHNFVVEFLLNFGILFGGIILLMLAFIGLKTLWIKEHDWRDALLIYYLVGFMTLMLSLSVYSSFEANAAVALFCAYISTIKRDKKEPTS